MTIGCTFITKRFTKIGSAEFTNLKRKTVNYNPFIKIFSETRRKIHALQKISPSAIKSCSVAHFREKMRVVAPNKVKPGTLGINSKQFTANGNGDNFRVAKDSGFNISPELNAIRSTLLIQIVNKSKNKSDKIFQIKDIIGIIIVKL